jgi:hypothetical protein
MPPEAMFVEMVLLPILGMGMGGAVLFGIYRTVNRALERKHERAMLDQGGAPQGGVEELQRRVESLEEVAYRVQDLEERLDFTERVLAQQKDRGRLPPDA